MAPTCWKSKKVNSAVWNCIPNILCCLPSDTWTDPRESTSSLHLPSEVSKVKPRNYILLFLQHLCPLVHTSVMHKCNCKLRRHAQASLDRLLQPSSHEAAHTELCGAVTALLPGTTLIRCIITGCTLHCRHTLC